ncbi:MAG: hypothetical protein K8R69_08055 [Deltaproteobacteria bacterium]|nr:hypothetical protein [Deltaproteobacteria bacterium]
MTLEAAKSQRKLRLVEMTAEEIRASYSDGSLEVDADAASEASSARTVDVFVQPKEQSAYNHLLITEERFRGLARLWGEVRSTPADREERAAAQESFEAAEARARIVFRDFSTAVKTGKVGVRREAPNRPYELYYQDPTTGMTRRFHLYPPEGSEGKTAVPFSTLSLEEEDGIRVVISNPKLLSHLRVKLDSLYAEMRKLNRKV